MRKVRASDLVIRDGGEEFLIVLLDANAEQAILVAEKIRAEVAGTKVTVSAAVLQKTMAIDGVLGDVDAANF